MLSSLPLFLSFPRAGGGPLSFALSSPLSSLLPLSFYAFLPAKDPLSLSGCRWVPSAGRYQCLYAGQGWGWMSFVKVPSLLFSSLFPGSFAGCFPPPPLPLHPGFRPALVAASLGARRAFKRETVPLPRRFLAGAAGSAIMCALLLRVDDESGGGMSTGPLSLSLSLSWKVVEPRTKSYRLKGGGGGGGSLLILIRCHNTLRRFPPPLPTLAAPFLSVLKVAFAVPTKLFCALSGFDDKI